MVYIRVIQLCRIGHLKGIGREEAIQTNHCFYLGLVRGLQGLQGLQNFFFITL